MCCERSSDTFVKAVLHESNQESGVDIWFAHNSQYFGQRKKEEVQVCQVDSSSCFHTTPTR